MTPERPTVVSCARAFVDGEDRANVAFAVANGRVAAIGSIDDLERQFPGAHRRAYGRSVAVIPGLIDGHSHAYQILLRGRADDLPFERWRDELYRIVSPLTPDDVFAVFGQAFREMLAAGISTVAEFFYLNGAGNAHAEAAIAAAREAGIRLVLARTWMDAERAPQAFREPIDVAAQRTSDLRAKYPDVDICVAPHSLHAASPEMIRAANAFAQSEGCMMHIHVAEAAYEGVQTEARFGTTPVDLLDRWGVLTDRTVAIHAIHITAAEKLQLARAGARVVHNPVTNQFLGDGICDVVELHRLGVPLGLGTDADVKPSILDEMRAAALLQKLVRFDGGALDAPTAFWFGTAGGARALGIDAGAIRTGAPADYAVVDFSSAAEGSPLCSELVYRTESSRVLETVVGGRTVFRK